mmetsp:Transcript_34538/g.39980  ORF Transcript_34538/g.39980 Transcript_34538/m.39980 type:complete len:91 (+) Transcript_34538:225-497(+)
MKSESCKNTLSIIDRELKDINEQIDSRESHLVTRGFCPSNTLDYLNNIENAESKIEDSELHYRKQKKHVSRNADKKLKLGKSKKIGDATT